MKDKKETTLLPLTNDLVFRVVYGRDTPECKEALTAMLNLIMGEKERPITDLSYENPITLSENIDIKGTEMDIKVSVRTRELVDTEMQVRVGSSYNISSSSTPSNCCNSDEIYANLPRL